jgi:acyl-CoA thioester hydrolase
MSGDERGLQVELSFTPKTYDIDFAGHVSNISYIRWLEDLRYRWLEVHFPLPDQLEEGIAPTLLRTEIDYRRQVKLFQQVVGRLRVEEAGTLRYVLAGEFTVEGEVVATALQTGVWINLRRQRPIRLPRALRERLNQAGDNSET